MVSNNESDDVLDQAIDKMLADFENRGKTYDQCCKAMQLAIDRAKQPVTIPEWVEIAKQDPAGRRKYSDDLFEADAVKSVVLDLVKKKKVLRLGRQTFCSNVVIGEMADAIDNVMMWESAICDINELAELLEQYGGQAKTKATMKNGWAISPRNDQKIKNFIEEQIVTKAMDTMESLVLLGVGEFIHYTTLEACCSYAKEALAGRWEWSKSMSKNEFFDYICRINFTGMDNQYQGRSINRIKECMQHGVVREYVLTELEKDKILTVTDGRVSPYKKFDKYAWLDD